MKMNYLLDRKSFYGNSPNGGGRQPWIYILLAVLVLLIAGPLIFRLIAVPATETGAPLRAGGQAMLFSFGQNIPYFSTRESLIAENEILKKQLKIATTELVERTAEVEELLVLEKAIGRSIDTADEGVISKVLAPAGIFRYDLFLVDRGRNNSDPNNLISLGDLAVTGDRILLGEVVEVGTRTSKIRLYSSAGRQTAVAIGANNILALAIGQGGGNYLATLPAASQVVHNDIVRATRGDREYILGLVGAIEKSEETPYQKILIKPPVNIYELRFTKIYSR